MNSFQFFSEENFDTGIYLNSHVDYTVNVSEYSLPAIIQDTVSSTSVSTYFNASVAPVPIQLPSNSWTSTGQDLQTTTSGASVTLPNISGYDLDIVVDNAPTGAFIKVYSNTQNLENISSYGPTGTQTIYRVPLNGNIPNTISLYNTGYSSKLAPFFTSSNTVGVSVGNALSLKLNGTSVITDTWVITATSTTTFTIHRNSTGVTNSYTVNLQNLNAIPGFDVSLNTSALVNADSTTINTTAIVANLNSFVLYPNLTTLGQWISPIMDSGDSSTVWTESRVEIPVNSTTSYMSAISVGNTNPPDITWNSFTPTAVTAIDYPNKNQFQMYRVAVQSCGALQGQYAQATLSLTSYTDYARNFEVFAWKPQVSTWLTLLGPVVKGPVVNSVMAAWAALGYKWYQAVFRHIRSNAINTSENTELFRKGKLLNLPIHLHETMNNYRSRLQVIKQAVYSGSTLNFIQTALQIYCNSTLVRVVPAQTNNQSWAIGQSLLGINTYLGTSFQNFWVYEVHIPGALPGVAPDELLQFIFFLNPAGAVPTLILE